MLQSNAHNQNQLVINWHLTEACNFSCRYCYAHWERHESVKDLIRQDYQIHQLLSELREFFNPSNSRNPLAWELAWSSTRLNIAGGEPLLFPSVVEETVKSARRVGLRASFDNQWLPPDRANRSSYRCRFGDPGDKHRFRSIIQQSAYWTC